MFDEKIISMQFLHSSHNLFFAGILFLYACAAEAPLVPVNCENEIYLHLSHTRGSADTNISTTVNSLDLSITSVLMLGGDLAYFSSSEERTMNQLNAMFHLDDPNTLWSPGNHDYTNTALLTQFTGRPLYYTYTKNKTCFVVLDTQDSLSNITAGQIAMLRQIADTISACKQLILLHHKLIWMYRNAELEQLIDSVSNAPLGTNTYNLNPNNFNDDVYPILLEIKQKGIDVFCVGGDVGIHVNSFSYITGDGIYYLASGCNGTSPENKMLLFEYDIDKETLEWQFLPLLNYCN